MAKVGLSLGSSYEKLFNKAQPIQNSMSSIVYVFPSCVPILPKHLIPNPLLVSFSITLSLKVSFYVLTLPSKKFVPSCQVCGKCIPVPVFLSLHHTGNRHNHCIRRFIIPFVRLSGSAPPILPTHATELT